MNISSAWPAVRAILKDHYSFNDIKTLASAATLPVHRLSRLTQGSGGASKGQLMDALDRLFTELGPQDQHRVVVYSIAEITRDAAKAMAAHEDQLKHHFYGAPSSPPALAVARERLEELLSRFGWGLAGDEPVPLQLQVTVEVASLPKTVKSNLEKALRRYRDGDVTGAMTSICATVDAVTFEVYQNHGLGNPGPDSYQKRATTAFKARQPDIEKHLAAAGLDANEVTMTANNLKQAVSNAGYVLGSFRRNFADVHGGISKAPPAFVQNALDAAVFIVRSIAG